jgi:hypothetical protein
VVIHSPPPSFSFPWVTWNFYYDPFLNRSVAGFPQNARSLFSSCPRPVPGSSQPAGRQDSSNDILQHDHSVEPAGSRLIQTSDGFRFYAPAWADLQGAVSSGEADRYNPWAQWSDFGFWGTYDFQRNGDTFINGWSAASNFAVGVGKYGLGKSREGGFDTAAVFASIFSSNAGDPNKALWQLIGWDAAASGACNGP